MKAHFTKGQRVECWFPGRGWIPGTVHMIWRGVIVGEIDKGKRFVEYDCILDDFGPDMCARFGQEHVRRPGRSKHSTHVLRLNKLKGGN